MIYQEDSTTQWMTRCISWWQISIKSNQSDKKSDTVSLFPLAMIVTEHFITLSFKLSLDDSSMFLSFIQRLAIAFSVALEENEVEYASSVAKEAKKHKELPNLLLIQSSWNQTFLCSFNWLVITNSAERGSQSKDALFQTNRWVNEWSAVFRLFGFLARFLSSPSKIVFKKNFLGLYV